MAVVSFLLYAFVGVSARCVSVGFVGGGERMVVGVGDAAVGPLLCRFVTAWV